MISIKRAAAPVLLVLLAITLCSCAGGVASLNAERPGDKAFRTVLKQEPSMLNIPIEASTDDLARVLNQTLRPALYKGSTKNRGVSADVVRNGAISVSAADNYLYITLPITVKLSYGMFETSALPMKLKFKATADITPDWRLHADISYLGLSDLLAEEVGIGPFSFKPRSIVEGLIQPVQKLVSDMIAQKVNDLFPLKVQVAKVWSMAQKPVLLDKNYSAWLMLTPRDVMLYPLYARNNRVRVSVGISTLAELVVGPEPAGHPLRPLPGLKRAAGFDNTFRIALNADLYFRDLRAIAATLLVGKRFDSDGKSILIKDLDLYGNGDRIVVKVQTEGSFDGVFYLTAKPAFDPKTGVFSVEDVDFDMQTENLLHRSADWLLHGSIRSMIQEKLNMNLSGQLEQSRSLAGKALSRMQLVDHMILKGSIKDMKFNDMIVQKDKISIQVFTEGESTIMFQ